LGSQQKGWGKMVKAMKICLNSFEFYLILRVGGGYGKLA